MSRRLRLIAALIALVSVAGPAAAAAPPRATAGPPVDYTRIRGLSQPTYSKQVHETRMLAMRDGIRLYIEVTRPKTTKRVPVITEISPYHGTVYARDGVRMLPEQGGLVKYFVPRGYAVLMVDLRGTGKSQGCLDHLGPKDQGDAKEVIEWAAGQRWSNGRVGTIGHSYPGASSVMSLAEQPKGLATAVTSAGLASMYDHQFQAGVPYLAQWAGPIEAYEQLALQRALPANPLCDAAVGPCGDNFGNDIQDAACGATQTSLVAGEAQLSGQYVKWHAERDFRKHAAEAPIPVFVIHGTMDNAARIAGLDWFYKRNGRVRTAAGKPVVDKLWMGQWDHGVGCCPNRRGYQWTMALHAWFDKLLQRRNVDTGPPVEIFLTDGLEQEAVQGVQTEIYTARRYPGEPRFATFYPDATGDLSSLEPFTASSVSFAGDPTGTFSRSFTGSATFRSRPLDHDVLFVGVPKLRLAASISTPRTYLIANVLDEDTDGVWRRMSQFAINPELRDGIGHRSIAVPGERYVMHPPAFPMAYHLRKGHRLVLRVTTSDPDKLPFFSIDPNVTVFTGRSDTVLQLPVVDSPGLYKDSMRLTPPKKK
jgi:predicted acyl esterase